MQKIYSVLYTMDNKYIISGSEDNNVRIWKSVANDSIKILNKREKDYREYSKKLIEKYQYMRDIKKIVNRKHLPKYIINKKKVKMNKYPPITINKFIKYLYQAL